MDETRRDTMHAALREAAAQVEVVRVPDGLPTGEVWVRRLTGRQLNLCRQKAKVVRGEDDEIVTDLERLNLLCLAEALVTGPEPDSPTLYGLSEAELSALENEVYEGYRADLISVVNALMGFRSGKARLDFLRKLGSSTSGACTEDSTSTSHSAPSGNSGRTTGS